jgi:hypothetical protein
MNMSPEPESDEAPLVFPLKEKNKRMQAKNSMLELAAYGLLGIPPERAVADADVDTPGACVLLPARVHRVRRVGMPIGRYLTRHLHYRCLLPCNGIWCWLY